MVGAIIYEPGNAMERKTGSWRSARPVVDAKKCIKCGICVQSCPDFCIDLAPTATMDFDYCKGCLICEKVCPVKAIGHEKEEK